MLWDLRKFHPDADAAGGDVLDGTPGGAGVDTPVTPSIEQLQAALAKANAESAKAKADATKRDDLLTKAQGKLKAVADAEAEAKLEQQRKAGEFTEIENGYKSTIESMTGKITAFEAKETARLETVSAQVTPLLEKMTDEQKIIVGAIADVEVRLATAKQFANVKPGPGDPGSQRGGGTAPEETAIKKQYTDAKEKGDSMTMKRLRRENPEIFNPKRK